MSSQCGIRKSFICMIFFVGLSLYAQEYDPFIADLVNETCMDSLVRYVRILSGEESVWLNGSQVLIRQRVDSNGRALAAEYIKQKLQSFGLDTFEQVYQSGKNIYARQAGTLDEYSIICAHYDAVTYYCADDNASSVAAVLEAARLLSRYQSDYTIVYALWDQEEIDLNGSRYYANWAAANDHDIRGVLNLEMLGWDSNNDGLFEIHTRNIANSVALANLLVHLVSVYDFPLDATVFNPGSPDSDHSPFWQKGYGAICQSQAYWAGDFNPYYHSSQDRINKFNLTYFLRMSKLSIAAIAALSSIKSPAFADLDFGDAPDDGPGAGSGEYNTCLSDDGPRHMIFSERIRLGEIIDAETDAYPNNYANGDNYDNWNDEDGVNQSHLYTLIAGEPAAIDISVTNHTGRTATLVGWIDFNGDGVFAADERVSTTVDNDFSGTKTLTFSVPLDAVESSYARFRISTYESAVFVPTGFALDGEVEDYDVFVTVPIDIELISFSAHIVDEGIKIIWQAASEINHAGYNIYRALTREGDYEKVNGSLITSESESASMLKSYEFVDNESPALTVFYKLEEVGLDGRSAWHDPVQVMLTADVEAAGEIPSAFDLMKNYPNPFNSATTIAYALPERSNMTLTIYDVQGKLIKTVVSGLQSAGYYSVTWDGTNDAGQFVPSGIFIYRMTAGDFHKFGRMTVLK